MSLPPFAVLLPWLIVGLGCWLGFQLLRQSGRILLRLEGMEQRLKHLSAAGAPGSLRPSLPIGSPAPEFNLPDLSGGRKALVDFQGRKLLLIFFDPRCGFCTQMAVELAVLPTD